MRKHYFSLAAAAAIALLASALYVPFFGNPMVFDDLPFFSGGGFAHSATTPFGLGLRLPAYFTLAFPQVFWGKFPPWDHAHVHRAFSLVFHIACALTVYKLAHDLLRATNKGRARAAAQSAGASDRVLAFAAAALFAIHPVAVYGAGYLMQRSIVLATMFSLLSVIYFVRGLSQGKQADALVAAAFYTLAVFSKEHSLLLPAVAVLAAPLIMPERRFATRYVATYLLACLPAAVATFSLVRGLVGRGYEPRFDVVVSEISGIPVLGVPGGEWLVSALTQAGLFFKYLALWLFPDTGAMAIDLRIDFAATWSVAWIVLKLVAFGGFGALGLALLVRRGTAGLIGLGMLYAWILFAVELGAVRFQEPFVLYRSYLWAPGILIAVAAALSTLPRQVALAFMIVAGATLFYQAHDRLQSFSSNLALWEDAAAKLPPHPVPLGSRILFGLAREQVYLGRLEDAAGTASRCLSLYPHTWHCNFSRGAVHAGKAEYEKALAYHDAAAKINPKSGVIHTHRGLALEKLGRVDEARQAYILASDLGFIGGDYRLGLLDDPRTGGSRVVYDASRPRKKAE